MSELKISKGAYEELTRLQEELGSMPGSGDVISYSPQCSTCGGSGCFHEEVQAWVCCQERTDPGCGKIIKTMIEYKKRHYG